MARFGEKWRDHEQRIAAAWQAQVAADDVVLLPGDVSWAQSPARAARDLEWLKALPGRKVLLRGNHDHWWRSIDIARKIAVPLGFLVLEGDSVDLDGVIVCGAMGHVAPHDPFYVEDQRKDRYHRELRRLEAALQHGAERRAAAQPMILMMHYPPFTSEGHMTEFAELIARYKPTLCVYGHLHRSHEWTVARRGDYQGVDYRLVAADFIEMAPQLVWTT